MPAGRRFNFAIGPRRDVVAQPRPPRPEPPRPPEQFIPQAAANQAGQGQAQREMQWRQLQDQYLAHVYRQGIDAAWQQGPPAPAGDVLIVEKKKPVKLKKLTRATATGRMKTVSLGDIIKAYERDDFRRDAFRMIDFRPVKPGEYFLGKSLDIEVADAKALLQVKDRPRLIMELIRPRKDVPELDEERLFR